MSLGGTGQPGERGQVQLQVSKYCFPYQLAGFLHAIITSMARMIPAAERIVRARALIQKARDYPLPPGAGRFDFSYVAQVKDLLRQARDLVKFIPNSPTATAEMKAEVKQILEEVAQTEKGILKG
jgi:hypothetical protein